jgi:hypothetical protein
MADALDAQKFVLTPEQMQFLPTEEDILFYQNHGWFITPKVIPDQMIDQAIEAMHRYHLGERDHHLTPVGFTDWQPGDGSVVRNNEFVSLQSWALREFALQPIIGSIAAKLTRSAEIRLLDDQLVYKPPSNNIKTAVGWHADAAYWSTCSSHRLLTAWIPFQDCDLDLGPLVVLDKSHHWQGTEQARYFNQPDLSIHEAKWQQEQKEIIKIPMTLRKGQLSFHHCWAIHGSYPNRGNQPRAALALHLQDGDNHYRPFWNASGEPVHIFDEQVCQSLPNGDPDFSDPKAFPTLWLEER